MFLPIINCLTKSFLNEVFFIELFIRITIFFLGTDVLFSPHDNEDVQLMLSVVFIDDALFFFSSFSCASMVFRQIAMRSMPVLKLLWDDDEVDADDDEDDVLECLRWLVGMITISRRGLEAEGGIGSAGLTNESLRVFFWIFSIHESLPFSSRFDFFWFCCLEIKSRRIYKSEE